MFKTLKSIILTLTLFLFPLFFLPFTQEFFTTNKLYLLIFADVILLFLTALQIFISNKLRFQVTKFNLLKFFFLATVLLSTLIISPNKIQALLNPNFGFISLLSIIIFVSYLEKSRINILKILSFSTLILSIVTIVFYFQPFQYKALPFELQFLKNRYFTPIGTQTDLAIFLAFMLLTQAIQLIIFLKNKKTSPLKSFLPLEASAKWGKFLYIPLTLLTLAALIFSLTNLYSVPPDPLMPFKYSWSSFAETLKNPFNAFFGIGIDNLPAAFTQVKDIAYNHSSLWQVRSFDVSRSTLLHIATESGLIGLGAILTLLYYSFKTAAFKGKSGLIILVILTATLVFFPPSLLVFFIFFLGLTSINEKTDQVYFPLNSIKFLYLSLTFLLIILTASSVFLLSQSYLAEYHFKQSVDALAKKNGKALYDNQRKAILANPFIERFHINFSQTNLLLANSLTKNSPKEKVDIKIAQEIAQIEATNAVNLNPQKASNWENLAVIARNLTDVFDDAHLLAQARAKSIGAYEKAILLDPQNPQYRFSLGTLYYIAGDFTEAIRSFEHAVALKTDWANAHYNLAWALYQKKDYEKAIKELEASISLLDKKKDQLDLAKAQKDLEKFKTSSLPTEASAEVGKPLSNPLDSLNGTQLNLPSDKPSTPEPKLDIFENTSNGEILNSASPESEF